MTGADIRFAIRSLQRVPSFTLAVVLTLALGIGANTAIFSVVRGVLLKPLPHRDSDRLLYFRQSIKGPGGENIRFSVPEILDVRQDAKSLAGVAEYSGLQLTLQGKDGARRIQVGLVTGNYFQVMGLRTILGRELGSGDDGTTVPPVMVMTHDFWQTQYGADPAIVGKRIIIDGREVEVVGVLQPAPTFPERMDAIMNMVISEHHTSAMMVQGRTHRMTDMIARLAPGATVEQARAEISTIRQRVEKAFPESYDPGSGYRVDVVPLLDAFGERARVTLWLLMAAAAFIMVIAAANVANLSLMRGVRREHELVVRAALGAGSARLRRLLLVENFVLAALGAGFGILIAIATVPLLTTLAARYSARAQEIRIDGVVLGFTLALTALVAIAISYAPSLGKEGRLGGLLASGLNRMSGSLRKQRLQRGLVVAQLAASVVLLTGAGLLTRTVLALGEVPTGLRQQEVLTMEVPISSAGRSDADTKATYERMRQELQGLPGVNEVGVGSTTPLRVTEFQLDVRAEGRALASGEAQPRADFRSATPEYFRAAGIPLLSGREFTSTDRDSTQRVVILNATLAKQLFGDRDPLGQRVAWTGEVLKFIGVSDAWRTVVGVVGDTKDGGMDAPPRPAVFMPFSQEVAFTGTLVIRASNSANTLVAPATRIVRNIAPQAPIENVLTVAQIKDQSVAPRRLNAMLLSMFGVLAVIIAAVGIAGVLAFSVSTRTTEIGIRMSLGATQAAVQRMILREGAILLAAGLILGAGSALLATRLVRGLLFGVQPYDPVTLVAVGTGMAAVGILACWFPARRASAIEPIVAIAER